MNEKTDRPTRHKWLFTLIAWSIPLLFLAMAEGALRLGGYGDDYDLFVRLKQKPQYLLPNPDVVKRFFNDPDDAPTVSADTGYFLADKPDNGLRIVVQGGSSAAGFPYGKNASPAGMLQQRLSRSFPDRTVEVILTAMSAINSYSLLDFADEIIAQQPDAIVIYAGHNEFIGILGVGSSLGSRHSPALTRFFLNLRDWRLFRLIQRLIGTLSPDREKRTGTLMAIIAGERSIPLDSEIFDQGVRQFRENLSLLLARYQTAGIPVFIGTLASNEKDQPPFIGSPAIPEPDWTRQVEATRTAIEARQHAAAMQMAARLVASHPDMADGHFLLGQAALGLADGATAKSAFQAARDHDRLRFRAPGVFNQVIRDAAAAHGATVVDVNDVFAAASPAGIIGTELMLEHLHPNETGYFVLGNVFFDALKQAGLGLDWKAAIPEQVARIEQPVTRIESLQGSYRVASLMHDWPFVEEKKPFTLPAPTGTEAEIAQAWYTGKLDWLKAMNQGLVHNQRTGDYAEAARIASSIADSFPFEAQPQHVAGMMLVRQTPPQGLRAIPYFHRAVTLDPRSQTFLTTLARAYFINGYPDAARATAERLLQLAPQNEIGRQIMEATDREATEP